MTAHFKLSSPFASTFGKSTLPTKIYCSLSERIRNHGDLMLTSFKNGNAMSPPNPEPMAANPAAFARSGLDMMGLIYMGVVVGSIPVRCWRASILDVVHNTVEEELSTKQCLGLYAQLAACIGAVMLFFAYNIHFFYPFSRLLGAVVVSWSFPSMLQSWSHRIMRKVESFAPVLEITREEIQEVVGRKGAHASSA